MSLDAITPALTNRLTGRAWAILLVYTATLNFFYLGSARTFTGHECFVAEIAREMVQTGDWLVPRVAGKPWLEKPPLPHWIVAGLGTVTGQIDELTARVPSALLGIVGVLLVASLAARWYGSTIGLLTGLIQATMFHTITYARLAEADIHLWVMVIGCLWIFSAHHVQPTGETRWYNGRFVFFTLLGLTQLVKGPLFGAVVALLPCLGFIVLQRSWRSILWFLHWPGILMAAVITVAWPAAILLKYPDAGELWWTHTFGRMAGEKVINPEPVWYYFVNLPWQIAPWTLMVLVAWPQSLRKAWTERDPAERFQWLWLLLPLLALSAIKAKHHHYLIHALPPCAIWAARGLVQVRDWLATRLPKFFAPRRSGWAVVSLFGLLWVIYAVINTQFLGRMDGYRDETAFLQRVNELRGTDRPLFIYRLEPSRLLLYSKDPIEVFVSPVEMQKRAQECGDVWVMTSVGQERELQWAGEPSCIERMEHSRRKHLGPFAQLAVYQMKWKDTEHRKTKTPPTE